MRSGDRPRDRVTEEEQLIFLTAVAGRSRIATGGSKLIIPLTAGRPVLVAQNFGAKPLYVNVRANQAPGVNILIGNDEVVGSSGVPYNLLFGVPDSFVPFVLLQGERIFALNPAGPVQQIVAAQLVL